MTPEPDNLPGAPVAALDTIIGALARLNVATAIAVPLAMTIVRAFRDRGDPMPDYTDAEVAAKIQALRAEAQAGREESDRWLREHGFTADPQDPS